VDFTHLGTAKPLNGRFNFLYCAHVCAFIRDSKPCPNLADLSPRASAFMTRTWDGGAQAIPWLKRKVIYCANLS
jgi:hypothetical protein